MAISGETFGIVAADRNDYRMRSMAERTLRLQGGRRRLGPNTELTARKRNSGRLRIHRHFPLYDTWKTTTTYRFGSVQAPVGRVSIARAVIVYQQARNL